MTLAIPRLLIGRTIVAVALNSRPDGRGGKAYNPVITLDNGAEVTFSIVETDMGGMQDGLKFHVEGEPGVRPEYRARRRP